MKTRVVCLLVLSIVLATAPAAMAQCLKCRPIQHACVPTTIGGFDECYWANDCIVGTYCGGFVGKDTPQLASEFHVVSVVRLDEAQPKATETRVAALEKVPVAKR